MNLSERLLKLPIKCDNQVYSFASILSACAKNGCCTKGMDIYHSINNIGIFLDILPTVLVDMHAKCGRIEKARDLFDNMPQRDVISWSAMITRYAQNGFTEKALETFRQMRLAGVNPDTATFASILPACAKMGDLKQGMNIHKNVKGRGILSDVVVATALVDMYAK